MQRDLELMNAILRGIISKPIAYVGVGNLVNARKTAVALGLSSDYWKEEADNILWLENSIEEIKNTYGCWTKQDSSPDR